MLVEAVTSVSAVKAKFHYAILVADRSEACRRPASSWNLAYSSELARASRPATSLEPVCDQDSVMEFGLPAANQSATRLEQVRAISTCRDSSNLLESGRRPV